jgi:hypothetical protein
VSPSDGPLTLRGVDAESHCGSNCPRVLLGREVHSALKRSTNDEKILIPRRRGFRYVKDLRCRFGTAPRVAGIRATANIQREGQLAIPGRSHRVGGRIYRVKSGKPGKRYCAKSALLVEFGARLPLVCAGGRIVVLAGVPRAIGSSVVSPVSPRRESSVTDRQGRSRSLDRILDRCRPDYCSSTTAIRQLLPRGTGLRTWSGSLLPVVRVPLNC